MLLDYLSKYLDNVEGAVKELEGAYVERYEEEILTANRINLRIRIRFQTGHMLEINESITGEKDQIIHLGYRYHFQDQENRLLFRYDNTPHFPDLNSFPDRKHLQNKVSPVEKPSILKVIEEARLLAQ